MYEASNAVMWLVTVVPSAAFLKSVRTQGFKHEHIGLLPVESNQITIIAKKIIKYRLVLDAQ